MRCWCPVTVLCIAEILSSSRLISSVILLSCGLAGGGGEVGEAGLWLPEGLGRLMSSHSPTLHTGGHRPTGGMRTPCVKLTHEGNLYHGSLGLVFAN